MSKTLEEIAADLYQKLVADPEMEDRLLIELILAALREAVAQERQAFRIEAIDACVAARMRFGPTHEYVHEHINAWLDSRAREAQK